VKRHVLLALLLCVFIGSAARAQNLDAGMGFQAYGSYHSSDFDSVNLESGNLILHIPLISFPQRGQLPSLDISITSNNYGWSYNSYYDSDGHLQFYYAFNGGSPWVGWMSDSVAGFSDGYPGSLCYFDFSVIDWSGASHAMGYVGSAPPAGSSFFYLRSLDGTGYEMQVPSTFAYSCSPNHTTPDISQFGWQNTIVFAKNGIQNSGTQNSSLLTNVTDKNGNTIGFYNTGTSFGYTDSLNRTIPLPTPGYGTAGGPGCIALNYPGPPGSGGTVPITYCYSPITITAPDNSWSDSTHYNMLQSVMLPNQRAWRFGYDSLGELSQVTTPTGGTVSYTWQWWYRRYFEGEDGRVLQYRDVNDGSGTKRWQYNLFFDSNNSNILTDVVTDPDGNDTVHLFGAVNYLESESRSYNGSSSNSGNLLKTVDKAYVGSNTAQFGNGYLLPTTVTTTLAGGQTSESCIYYDNQSYSGSGVCPSPTISGSAPTFWDHTSYNLTPYQAIYGSEVERDEHDYGSGGPGALLRKTVTTYQYGNQSYLNANIMDRVSQITIYNGGGGQVAQTTNGYDEPENGNATCVCGNLTSVTRWLSGGNNPPTRYVYNTQGMRTQLYYPNDADGSPSEQYFYDGTGAFFDHITYRDGTERFSYDSNTGLLIDHYGLNSEYTHYTYDNMRRLKTKTQPDGAVEQFNYDDNTPSFTFRQPISSGASFNQTGTVDGLGRQIRTDTLVPGTTCSSGHVYVDTTYDGEGRKKTESNPYCTTGDSTYGVTTYYYDALGRICVVAPPDGTVPSTPCPSGPAPNDVTTSYSGNVATTTDQAGNQHNLHNDALGRLTEVDEPAGNSATSGSGSFTVYGSEQPPTNGTPGQRTFTISLPYGGDQSRTFPNTPGSGYVVISGSEGAWYYCSPPQWVDPGGWWQDCEWINDNGDVYVTVNGWTLSVTYPAYWDGSQSYQTSYSSQIAAVLANVINSTGGYPVSASAQDWGDGQNATLWLTAAQPGSQTNYPLSAGSDGDPNNPGHFDFTATPSGSSLTGGSDYTIYDSGSVSIDVTVNSTVYHHSSPYGQSMSVQNVVSCLVAAFNGGNGGPACPTNSSDPNVFVPSSSSPTLTVSARTVGLSTNYSYTIGSTSNRPDLFQPSFTLAATGPQGCSGNTLCGGSDSIPNYDSGTVSISVNGYSKSTTYGQASTSSSVASALARGFNADSASPVNAYPSGSTIQFVAKATGSVTNFPVSTNCVTNTGGFTHASFYWTSSAPSSTTCPTGSGALSGGADGGSLSSPMITLYFYDALDNLTGVQQKGGDSNSGNWRNRSFNYDGMSRLFSASNPESGTTGYGYDTNSNLRTKTTPLGTISYCYDAMNRLTSKSYSNTSNCSSPVATYGYDGNSPSGCSPSLSISNPLGHRTGMCDLAGNEAWSYDAMGRPTADRRVTNNVPATTSYVYNFDGSVYQLTYPSNRTVTYTPNIAAQPASAVDTGNNVTYVNTALYTPHGALRSVTYGSGANPISSLYYNTRLQPCRIAVNTAGSAPGSCSDATNTGNIMDFTYDFHLGSGDNGNAYRIANNRAGATSRGINYRYDPVNRIAGAFTDGNLWGEGYVIDGWGNLKAIGAYMGRPTGENPSQGANTNNQLTNMCSGTCYDAAGDVINDGLYTYAYDVEGHLTSGAGVTYNYDGDGKRVLKSNGTPYEIYWYGMGNDALDETDQSGNFQNEYIFFGGNRIARRDSSGNVYYYFADHLGTSRNIVQAGQTTACYDADFYPFGGEITYTNSCPQNQKYKFTGKERDSESGLDNFGARYNTSRFGRFMSPDPGNAGATNDDPQSWNGYAYVGNNPTRFTDPDGLDYHVCIDAGDPIDQNRQRCFDVLTKSDLEKIVTSSPGASSEGNQHNGQIFATVNGEQLDVGTYQHFRGEGDERGGLQSDMLGDTILGIVSGGIVSAGQGFLEGLLGTGAREAATGAATGAAAGTSASAAREVTGLVTQAATTVANRGAVASSREVAMQAAEEWVGVGSRPIYKGSEIVGKISADGTKVYRTTSINSAQPYVNLVNKVTGGNLHIRF
jgi:RHS repeat-associated protein